MKTSFVALAQDHTDHEVLKAVRSQLETMHTQLEKQGRSLVIALERSQENVRTDPVDIAELHNEGVVQSYFDDMRKQGLEPSLQDFKNKHEQDLRWDSRSIQRVNPDDINGGTKASRERAAVSQQNFKIQGFYNKRAEFSENTNNLDKGRSRIQEAAIYDFARANGIKIVGLDALTDKEKNERLMKSNGKMDHDALEDMEYERIQGMAGNACNAMNDLAQGKGGCVVAINMGIAHMGSLDLALKEQISQTPGLEGSKVTMCNCINGPEATSVSTAQGFMKMSVKDMSNAHQRLVGAEARLQGDVDIRTRELQARKFLNQTLTSMEGSTLTTKLQNPADFAKELCEQSPEVNALYGSKLEKLLGKAALKIKDGSNESKADLCERIGADQDTIQNDQEALEMTEQELLEAKQKVADHQKVLQFSNEVDSHVQNIPLSSFVTVSAEKGYGPGLAEVGKQATQLSVMEKLAMKGPKLDNPRDSFLSKKQKFEQFQKGDTDQPELQKPGKAQRSEEMQKMKEKFEAFQSGQGESPSRKVHKL